MSPQDQDQHITGQGGTTDLPRATNSYTGVHKNTSTAPRIVNKKTLHDRSKILAVFIITGCLIILVSTMLSFSFLENRSIIERSVCEPPMRTEARCSEIIVYDFCKQEELCRWSHDRKCKTVPASYLEGLLVKEENCRISNGNWGTGALDACVCPEGSEALYPADGFCINTSSDLSLRKELPESYYRHLNFSSRFYDLFPVEPDARLLGDEIIDPLLVTMHPDFYHIEEGDYIACLYGGAVVGSIDFMNTFLIAFGSRNRNDAYNLIKSISKEPTVESARTDFILPDLTEDPIHIIPPSF